VDDAELLAAWRAGQRAAGDVLVRRHISELLGFFRLRAPQAADDLVQRTLLACTEGKERIASSSFRGFLFGVARRQLLKFLDEQRRSADDEGLYFQPGTRPASVITPSGVVALRQEHWLLLQALARLDDDQQIALALYYVQGLSTREIGEACDVPASTVTSRLHRARAALRDALSRDAPASSMRDGLLADLDRWMASLAPLTHVLPVAT
jgi:RNA polymerase sigma factor (sigma-70 family)